MTDHAALIAKNTARWTNARLTRGPEFEPVARRLVAAKARYQAVEQKTGVPWFVIAVIHQRESSQNFLRSLAQGDPWNKVSTHVPAGRGPFASWEAAAVDALAVCPPYAAKWRDWSAGGAMTLLEIYNGLGYCNKGLPSPYVWSGTDQYARGKYVADGVFDANVVDKQLGCAGLILAMMALDASIRLGAKSPPQPAPIPQPKPAPRPALPPQPAPMPAAHKTGIAAVIVAAAGAMFEWGGEHPGFVLAGLGVAALITVLIIFKKG